MSLQEALSLQPPSDGCETELCSAAPGANREREASTESFPAQLAFGEDNEWRERKVKAGRSFHSDFQGKLLRWTET